MNNRDDNIDIFMPQPEAPVVIYHDLRVTSATHDEDQVAVLPGSFNPLHAGHRNLKMAAEAKLKRKVVFEISVANVQKKTLAKPEVLRRLRQFDNETVAVTHAPLFLHKADLFPGCCFVVGVDTAIRIVDRRFYGNDDSKLQTCLQQFSDHGHSFLVAGRIDANGHFCGVNDIEIPVGFQQMFIELSESEFREDVSSTQLRKT